MEYDVKAISEIVKRIVDSCEKADEGDIPVGVSNRHIHLSQEHLEILFGKGYELQKLKDLSQPGQYACKEQLTLIGPSLRAIEGVRVLGPVRKASQVEISRTDSFTLKVKPPVRESGSIEGSAPVTIVGPKGLVTLKEGCILANRHIHMSDKDGERFGVKDGEYVAVEVNGDGKRTALYDVQVRVSDKFALEMHLDTDDANACGIGNDRNAFLGIIILFKRDLAGTGKSCEECDAFAEIFLILTLNKYGNFFGSRNVHFTSSVSNRRNYVNDPLHSFLFGSKDKLFS